MTIVTKGPVGLMMSPRKQKLFSIIGFFLSFLPTLIYITCVPGDHSDHDDHGTIELYECKCYSRSFVFYSELLKRRNLQVSSFEKFTGGVAVGWWPV